MRYCPNCGNKLYEFCPNCQHKYGYKNRNDCFIATSAYGSTLSFKLDLLRHFRDSVLLQNYFLSWLIRIYYQVSPSIAKKLQNNDQDRIKVRNIIDKSVLFLVKRENTSNPLARGIYCFISILIYMYVLLYAYIITYNMPNPER